MFHSSDKKQSIVDFFDPYNIEHIDAYSYLSEKGVWPKGFSDDCEYPFSWQIAIISKMADAWVYSIKEKR